MTSHKAKIQGEISVLTIIILAVLALAVAYYYIDNKADSRTQQSLMQFVDEAHEEGVELSYTAVDASPLFRSVSISDFKITGNTQEPDITLGNITISGLNWHDFTQDNDKLPLAMSFTIDDATLHLKPSMIENDADLQALLEAFGEKVHFSSHFSYDLDLDSGVLVIATTETIVDNLNFNSELSFGNANWLTKLDTTSQEKPISDMMSTTLNSFSVLIQNEGIIEKIRAVAAKKTGKSQQALTQDSVTQIKQLQQMAKDNWGPLFVPMIDEVLKFTVDPQQLQISIHPDNPLTSDDLMLGLLGGDAGLLTLIKQAKIEIKAN